MLTNRNQKLLAFTVVAVVLLMLVSVTSPAMAEEKTMTMKQLYYSIWPEYDKSPEVLVIYSGTFVNDTGEPFQGELRYKIPKNADINMVCETEKGMLCQRYILKKDNPDYDVIVWKPSHPVEPGAEFPIMMEYYYKPFEAGSNPKAFTQIFRPAFPLTNLTIEIKAPKGASEVKLTPEAQQTQGDSEGFTNYYYQYANLTPEDQLTFDVSYVRTENTPSVQANNAANNANNQEPKTESSLDSTIVILLVVFILLLGVFLFFAVSKNNQNKSRSTKSKAKKKGGVKGKGGGNNSKAAEEKRKLRKLLIDGKISEETYQRLLEEIDE